jgi:hypothetical protein
VVPVVAKFPPELLLVLETVGRESPAQRTS